MNDKKDSVKYNVNYNERDCKKCAIDNDDECYVCDSFKRNNVINHHDFELSSFIYNLE